MSIVVAVTKHDRTVMAADTQTSFGTKILPSDNHATTKIRTVGNSLLGRVGWGVYENILEDVLGQRDAPELDTAPQIFRFFTDLWKVLHQRYSFVNDQAKSKNSPFGDLGGSFVIANRQGIFYVAPNLGVTRFKKYYAIGTGADHSLGALHQIYDQQDDVEQIARAAVQTAVAFNVNCGGEIQSMEVP